MPLRIALFLVINFGALALGGLFTSSGVSSTWYADLDKAPWTPPGWVFGFAWTSIMVTFSVYMAYLWGVTSNKKSLTWVYALQWILNVGWNPLFFYYHQTVLALLAIIGLTILVLYLLVAKAKILSLKSLFILPYALWLLIATSLNAYICFYN